MLDAFLGRDDQEACKRDRIAGCVQVVHHARLGLYDNRQ
jgi:hypothetical protein